MAISLYIHIPFCQKKCPYCGFYSVPIAGACPEVYIKSVQAELDGYSLRSEQVNTVYIGGGSPSVLAAGVLDALIIEIKSRFDSIKEFTVEVNPSQIDFHRLKTIHGLGVDRLSIGAQSFRQSDLDFLGRPYKVDDILRVYMAARNAGFKNISLDMISALPGTTLEDWKHNLETVIKLSPEHVSAYSLTYEEGTPLRAALDSGAVVPLDETLDRAMYEMTIDMLGSAGIEQYEISNYAKAGFQCRHNKSYWYNTYYIGVGAAAGSFYENRRYENVADVSEYIKRIQAGQDPKAFCNELTPEDVAHETAVVMLRLREGIDLNRFKVQTGFDAMSFFAEPIEENLRQGLIKVTPERLYLAPEALPIADSVICDFA